MTNKRTYKDYEKDLAILDYIKENIKNGAILVPSELVEDNEDFKEWLDSE